MNKYKKITLFEICLDTSIPNYSFAHNVAHYIAVFYDDLFYDGNRYLSLPFSLTLNVIKL